MATVEAATRVGESALADDLHGLGLYLLETARQVERGKLVDYRQLSHALTQGAERVVLRCGALVSLDGVTAPPLPRARPALREVGEAG